MLDILLYKEYNSNMKFTFDREKTDKLLFAFFNATKIPISLFDLNFQCISSFDEMPRYCKNILSTTGLENSCAVCDNNHFDIVTKTKKTMTYTCHAGICEVLAPVMYGDEVIAYLMLGRFRDEEHIYSSEEKMCAAMEKYNIPIKVQKEAYYALPVVSSSVLHSAITLAKACVQLMWTEQIIQTKSDLTATRIEEYIREKIGNGEKLTVDMLCEKFYLTKPSLLAVFHREFNDSPGNYILNYRINKAKKLLRETSLSIQEISEKSCFTDYNYFSRIFRKKLGMSPSTYRRKGDNSEDL